MRRKFFTNISLLLVINIIVKAFWVLGIDRTVQNEVGADAYGLYFSLFSFSVLFNILLDFGITNYNNRRVASDPSVLTDLLGNIFILRLVFAVVYALICLIIAGLIGYDQERMKLLYILIFNQFLASAVLYFRSNISALQLFRTDSFLSVADRFLMILICGTLLWGNITDSEFRIEWFVYCQTASYGLTFLLSMSLVIIKGSVKKIRFSINSMKGILRESAPFAVLSLFMAVYWRIDTVMIERILPSGTIEVGIYAQAFRLLDAASMIPYLFAVLLLPMFSRMFSTGDHTGPLIRLASAMLIIPASVVAIVSFYYPLEIMDLLYHEHVDESAAILAILMTGFIPVAVVYIFSTLLTAGGNLKSLNIIAGSGMIMNILLNFILIPKWGAKGSAIASVSTQVLMAVLFYLVSIKKIIPDLGMKFIVQIISSIAVIILSGSLFYRLGLPWYLAILLLGIMSLISPFIINLIRVSEVLSLTQGNSK